MCFMIWFTIIIIFVSFFKEAKRTSEKDGLAHEMTPLKSEGSDYFLFYFFFNYYFGLLYVISVLCSVKSTLFYISVYVLR